MATDVVGKPRPPWPVLAYLPIHIFWNVAFRLVQESPLDPVRMGVSLLLPAAIAIGLWRRGRVAWIIAVALEILTILLGIGHLMGELTALGAVQIGGALLLLALLLSPATRRWCS